MDYLNHPLVILFIVVFILAILDKQITLDPENNMLLLNPIICLAGVASSSWQVFALLMFLNILIYKLRINNWKFSQLMKWS